MLRKLLTGLLVLALLFAALPVAAFAAEGRGMETERLSDEASEEALPFEEHSPDMEDRTYADYRLEMEETEPLKAAEKASATEGSCGSALQWSFLSDSGELVISGTGEMEDYSVGGAPWYSLRGKIRKLTVQEGVSYLGKYAFRSLSNLEEVSLPGSLRKLGYFCFQDCGKLTGITFPEGLETIGYGAFNLADLRAIHIPASMTFIDELAFYGCEALNEISVAAGNETYSVVDGVLYDDVRSRMKLCPANRTEHLVIPDTVQYLPDEALAHCTVLEGVTIPDGLSWSPNAFTFCAGFLNIYTYDTNPDYCSVDGVLYSKNQKTLVLFPAGRSGSYTALDGTVEIAYGAFCRMKNQIDITLPDSVEVIGGSAFSFSTGLRNLKLSANLRELYAHAFNGCSNMNNVVLPESLTSLGYGCFENCKSITEITVPSRITSIATDTFRNCSSLKKVELKGEVTAIYSYAFYYCRALETINFPESLDQITLMAFYFCDHLQGLELPMHMSYLGAQAFGYCKSITKVEIPQGIEEVPSSAFQSCDALKEVVLPNGLKTIAANAFYSTAIEQLVIPETVTSLGNGVFRWCDALHCIHFLGDAPAITDQSFQYTQDDLVLYYTEEAEGWSSPQWNGISTALWSYDYSSTATCTLSGEEHFRCKHCSLELTRRVGPNGHSFGQWILEKRPTQEQEGCWIRTCSVCGAQEREIIPMLLPAEQDALVSNNVGQQNYSTYAKTVKSYLIENADGTLTRVEAAGDTVCIEKYSADFQLIEAGRIAMELPIFGGFYEGETDYFVVFGQDNPQEEDDREVVRVVRYSKDWLRRGQSSLCGANTCVPFQSGSLRMTQYGDMLYVHTCHSMYKSSDGLNHQANMIFSIYLPDMVISDQYTQVMNVSYGYVSHSFNQFVLTDGNKLLTLNHGDAYPRSAVIVQYGKPAGELQFTGQCKAASILSFYGAVGQNTTGASLGAFELSSSAYLTAGNSIVQDGSVSTYGQRNIFLAVTPRGEIGTADSSIRWITNHGSDAGIAVSTPHLVKIDDGRFLLLWTENDSLRYVFVNANGEATGQVYEAWMPLSDCKPIVYQGAVCWYVTQNSKPLFCSIPLDQPEKPVLSQLEVKVTLDPNGGTLESNTLSLVYGKPYGTLPTPERKSAYRFLGWFNSPYSSAAQITEESIVSVASDHKLYAHWELEPHSCQMELTETIPATCTSGEIRVYTCIYCDRGYRSYDNNYVHTWDEGVVTTQPTCEEPGVKTFTCTLCGAVDTEAVPPTGHSYTETVVPPTCLEQGYTVHRCACGKEYTDSFVAALGHEWGEGTITIEPGCETEGEKVSPCVRCEATNTESIPATGHSYTDTV
ncbi:MAG: leucine-rich repeat protein, partial [Oscillospiraceae bacterium]|nr:leucine-rich repeat protein [Oscillospiraceae bacterium]